MAQDVIAGTAPRFTVGRTLSLGTRLLIRNFIPFIAITAILSVPSLLLAFWLKGFPIDPQGKIVTARNLLRVGTYLVGVVTTSLTYSVIIFGTLQNLRSRKADLSECIISGLRLVPKVAVAAILWMIAICIGSMLLIVPGLILMAMFWVYTPAIVVEDVGITESFGRSRALTKGHRWGIFGLLLIVGVIFMGWQFAVMASMGIAGFTAAVGSGWLQWVVFSVSVLLIAYMAVIKTVGYYYLRAEKEGIAIDEAASVFD